ncbi:hypothetical protein [uncultured Deinococcus sp.]|uniref:hypothetical protein n=1 Tax=uncultured Deinococcus sp. TaxID=158789 RepID=UPI0025F6D322|nr:hypothetical protein [uncultured Deinococcus sp.]
MKPVLSAVTLLALLSACRGNPVPPDTREAVAFATDPRILRGVWTAQLALGAGDPTSLTLDLTATYHSESSYTVAGRSTLAGQTSAVEGFVNGSYQHRYLQAQLSQVPAGLWLRFPDSPNVTITCPAVRQTGSDVRWTCRYLQGMAATDFTLTRGTP